MNDPTLEHIFPCAYCHIIRFHLIFISFVCVGTIVGVSVAIIIVLFAIQQFGTNTIGYAFAPIMVVFFAFNSGVGVYNIITYSPSIFKACRILQPLYLSRNCVMEE